jgi:hypothetical protein
MRVDRHTPEADTERERFREEVPRATPDESLLGTLAALRAERERHNLSLADVAKRTHMDKETGWPRPARDRGAA